MNRNGKHHELIRCTSDIHDFLAGDVNPNLAPHIDDFLAADFNVDWDLDHLDAEAVYRNVLDGLLPSERTPCLFEAHLLRMR